MMDTNLPETTLSTYSIMWDVMAPDANNYVPLLQNDLTNSKDGSLFLNQNKVGLNAGGLKYNGNIPNGQWRRILFVVENNYATIYVDGEIAKQYLKDGGVPMVIIMPNGLSDFYSGAWEQYFYQELMPKVETAFGCNGKRAIAGLSMGGFGTVYHALKYPGKYTCAYAMSPAVSEDLNALVDAQPDKSVFPGFTFEVGNQDTTVDNAKTELLASYMKKNGLQVEYVARNGYHFWDFWQECLPKALKKAGDSF